MYNCDEFLDQIKESLYLSLYRRDLARIIPELGKPGVEVGLTVKDTVMHCTCPEMKLKNIQDEKVESEHKDLERCCDMKSNTEGNKGQFQLASTSDGAPSEGAFAPPSPSFAPSAQSGFFFAAASSSSMVNSFFLTVLS